MSKNVFRIGDVVYHPINGKGRVSAVDESVTPYYINFGHGCGWSEEQSLSFSPWPAPNHTRPIQEGWWIATYEGQAALIELRKDGWVYDSEAYCLQKKDRYEFIRFLGKDWRGEA